MKIVNQSIESLNEAVTILNKGGVVICPTDTIYGFLADATNKKAVEKIYKIKKRPRSKPLPIFVKDLKMAKELAEIDDRQEKILKKYWPGKYTFVLKAKNQKPKSKIYGINKDTIAIRVPKYKFLNDLLKKINKPLVQTSVNISAREPLNYIADILATFGPVRIAMLARKATPSVASGQRVAGGENRLVDLMIDLSSQVLPRSKTWEDKGSLKNAKSSKIIDLNAKHLTRLR